MGNDSIRLVFVFNHKYDRNIEKLETIYRDRFPDIRYLVPFYKGPRRDVIAVYESSAQFQGYFAQAAHAYVEPAVSHYVFIADDLLLNPEINADNLLDRFKIGPGGGSIEQLLPLNKNSLEWPHLRGAMFAWEPERLVMYRQEIPTVAEATERFARNGVACGDLTWKNLRGLKGWGRYPGWRQALKTMIRRKGRFPLPYPMVLSYSDLVIVPREAIHEFVHLCGVFAAMRLWVEVAIPTALALSCDRVSQYLHAGCRRRLMWAPAEVEDFERKTDRRVDRAFDVLGKDHLFVHPVKLSRWTA